MNSLKNAAPKFLVGIGGSAGGLEAYQKLLRALPVGTGMAFVIIAHLDPYRKSMLVPILSRATDMRVTEATEGALIQPNEVYVIPPNTNLFVVGDSFKTVSPRTLTGGRHNQIDYFLGSLAESYGPRAISIIFSGGDGDGTKGCEQIKLHGGVTFAQDESAIIGSMPDTATNSGCVDFVMSPAEIAEELEKIAALVDAKGK